jgi:hypothetical protein
MKQKQTVKEHILTWDRLFKMNTTVVIRPKLNNSSIIIIIIIIMAVHNFG